MAMLLNVLSESQINTILRKHRKHLNPYYNQSFRISFNQSESSSLSSKTRIKSISEPTGVNVRS